MEKTKENILVVDDSKSVCYALREHLDAMGYRVETAFNGEDALNKFPSFEPAIVLSDLVMPSLDGIGLLKKIKISNARTEVIIMTGHGDINNAIEAMKNGAYDFLLKPVDFNHLGMVIQRCLDSMKVKKEKEYLFNLNEMKDKFIGLVNHEFRTPLSIISASHNLLKVMCQGGPGSKDGSMLGLKTERILSVHEKAISALTEIVNRFDDFSLIQEGHLKLRPSWFPLEDLLGELVDTARLIAMERKLAFELANPLERLDLFADRRKLYQILMELMMNAVKYTPDGGTITISSGISEGPQGKWLKVSVKDTGIGVPEDKQSLIFDKFYEVQKVNYHSTSKSRFMGGGLGLGLPYVRLVADIMRGKVSVESREEKGSVFTLSIPVLAREREAETEKNEKIR